MKLIVSRNSWHYRLAERYRPYPARNLCTYLRQVLIGGLITAGWWAITGVIILIIAFPLYVSLIKPFSGPLIDLSADGEILFSVIGLFFFGAASWFIAIEDRNSIVSRNTRGKIYKEVMAIEKDRMMSREEYFEYSSRRNQELLPWYHKRYTILGILSPLKVMFAPIGWGLDKLDAKVSAHIEKESKKKPGPSFWKLTKKWFAAKKEKVCPVLGFED